MTHQPPVPAGNTPPYPLQPAPIPEEVKQRHAEEEAAKEAARAKAEAQEKRASATILGVGAALAVGAAAAVTGLLYAGRRTAKPAPAKARANARPKSSARAKSAPASSAAPAKRTGGDDKTKRGAADRRQVAAGEPYEVAYFARKHGLTATEARAIIKEAGPDRKAANALAEKRKGK